MSLDAIPSGAQILIDANILVFARHGASGQCRRLLERCLRREVSGLITLITVAEYCHRRMMQEAQSRGLSGSNPAKALAQDPRLVRQLILYRREVEDLLAGELHVVANEAADFYRALDLQSAHGLLTNDSLNLAAGLRCGVSIVATADRQFDSVEGITVFRPDDLSWSVS